MQCEARDSRYVTLCLLFVFLLLQYGYAQGHQQHWVGTWAAAQQTPEPQNMLPAEDLEDATLRQIVHLSIGGESLRIHLSNTFGVEPLHLAAVHVARARSASESTIDHATDAPVTFAGKSEVTIPAGAEYWSDAIPLPIPAFANLAVSIYYKTAPKTQTGHPGSRATSWYVHGNAVAKTDLPTAKAVEHWYQLSEVDVRAEEDATAIVTLGDSITDGHGATTNGNDRWPDILAQRLQSTAATRHIGVLNTGIGGNRILLDGLGPNALARFDRDVMARPGAAFLIVLEGVNDLGSLTRNEEVSQAQHQALVEELTATYAQMVERAHARGIFVIGATILPYEHSAYYHPGPLNEQDRQAVNTWIRTPGHFDAVVDFDKVVADPAHPAQLLAEYDSGDHLHPSPAGYRALAGAIPLNLFSRLEELKQHKQKNPPHKPMQSGSGKVLP